MTIEEHFEKELKELSLEEKKELLKMQTADMANAEESANAFFQTSKIYSSFIQKAIMPVLNTQFDLKDREKLLFGLFIRTFQRLDAITHLDSPKYFETIASTLRTIFEIMVDIALISDNKISDGVKKYYKYVESQRYEYARKYVENVDCSKLNEMEKSFYTSADKYIKEILDKIDVVSIYNTYWGQDKPPKTWTGKDIFSNADLAGYDKEYRFIYARICWDTHSGVTNILGMNKDYFPSTFAINHMFIHKFIANIIRIIAKEFHLYKVAPGLNKSLQTIENHTGAVLVQKQIDKIKSKRKNKSS